MDTENIYYNISVYNNNSNITFAKYFTKLNVPIITDKSNYKLSINKFKLPATNIPLFNYNNDGILCITYNNVDYVETVILTNLDIIATPNKPQTIITNSIFGNQIGLGQNIVYYFNQFLQAINYTLELIIDNINTANATAFNAPYFIFDVATQLFSLIVERTWDPSNVGYNGLNLYSNSFIADLFFSMPNYYDDITNLDYKQIQYMVYNTNNNSLTSKYVTPAYAMRCENSSTSYWFQVTKILLVSNTMNVSPTNISSINQQENGINKVSNIIADFDLSFNDAQSYRSPINFVQLGYKNKIDFMSSGPLSTIDIQAFWQNIKYEIFPITLSQFESFEIELMFIKSY